MPCEPTRDAYVLLPAATTTNADEHRDDDLASGCACGGELRGCRGSGAPFGLDGLGKTWLARIREYAAALRCRLRLGFQVVEHVSESVAWQSRRRRKTGAGAVRCRGRQSSRLLRWARQGAGADERGAAAEGALFFGEVGPLWRVVWGPRAGVGIRGRTQRTSFRVRGYGELGFPQGETETQAVDFSREGWG